MSQASLRRPALEPGETKGEWPSDRPLHEQGIGSAPAISGYLREIEAELTELARRFAALIHVSAADPLLASQLSGMQAALGSAQRAAELVRSYRYEWE